MGRGVGEQLGSGYAVDRFAVGGIARRFTHCVDGRQHARLNGLTDWATSAQFVSRQCGSRSWSTGRSRGVRGV